MVSPERKNLNKVEMFKTEIRKRETTQYKCKLCLPYIQNVGYVNSNC